MKEEETKREEEEFKLCIFLEKWEEVGGGSLFCCWPETVMELIKALEHHHQMKMNDITSATVFPFFPHFPAVYLDIFI